MSSSLCIVGIKPPDETWRKMKAVYDSCLAAGVAAPREVINFFNGECPDDAGVVLDLTPSSYRTQDPTVVSEYKAEMRDGFEVDLALLPKDIKRLRFYVSY